MIRTISLPLILCISFLLLPAAEVFAQDDNTATASRETIPEELLRPRRGEAPRYAVDTVIGPLGRGEAPADAYTFARKIAENLIAGTATAANINAASAEMLKTYTGVLEEIGPRNFRLGGGRTENDGSVSFLIRFIGRELAITGELYVRLEVTRDEQNNPVRSTWIFEELILEEAQNRKEEHDKLEQRFDFPPYHRFY